MAPRFTAPFAIMYNGCPEMSTGCPGCDQPAAPVAQAVFSCDHAIGPSLSPGRRGAANLLRTTASGVPSSRQVAVPPFLRGEEGVYRFGAPAGRASLGLSVALGRPAVRGRSLEQTPRWYPQSAKRRGPAGGPGWNTFRPRILRGRGSFVPGGPGLVSCPCPQA